MLLSQFNKKCKQLASFITQIHDVIIDVKDSDIIADCIKFQSLAAKHRLFIVDLRHKNFMLAMHQ